MNTIIFDLGGIFIQIDTKQSLQKICDRLNSMSIENILNILIRSDHYLQYEKGFIDSHIFYERVKRDLGGNFSFGFFKKVWQQIFSPVQPMIDLLPHLKSRYQLVLLSNTNVLHMEYIEKHFPFFHYFDHIIYSYRVGMIKPDIKIFHYTLNKIQSRAEDCVFIDDTIENILAAETVGIRSYQFVFPHYIQRADEESMRFPIQHVLLDHPNMKDNGLGLV